MLKLPDETEVYPGHWGPDNHRKRKEPVLTKLFRDGFNDVKGIQEISEYRDFLVFKTTKKSNGICCGLVCICYVIAK